MPTQIRKKVPISLSFLATFFVLLFSLFILFSSGRLDSEDGWLYASVARNIYYNHQIASAPYEYPEQNVHMNTVQGKDGIWRAPGSLGYSLSLAPAVALSDLTHRFYKTTPPNHFPLEHDWSFHFFASFTNAFWGAILGVFVLLYALELKFTLKQATGIAITTLLTTNLLVLTKLSFAHMMFTACLVASFYFIKLASQQLGPRKTLLWILAALCYVLLAISYNVTYYLPLIPLCAYVLLLEKPSLRKRLGVILLVAIALFALFFWQRFLNILGSIRIGPKVLFEGVWGFLFSSGKSIFLYSPPLLLIPLFWHHIKKKLLPELIAFGLLALIYLYFIGSASIMDHGLPAPIWHGGMSWGPRYLSPLIPFGMILVFHIINTVSKWTKKIIVIPLFVLGFGIQVVGTSVEYLQQYRDIPYNIFVGKAELTVYDYASFIPRYSPLIRQSKVFLKQLSTFPSTVRRGSYQVRFYDGFDIPYWTSVGTFRGFRHEGYISLTNPSSTPLSISLLLYNAPDTASSSAIVNVAIGHGDQSLTKISLPSQKEETISFTLPAARKLPTTLSLLATYSESLTVPHVIYIKQMTVNGESVNLASLDYPEVSTTGPVKTTMPYRYFGNRMNDRWKLWHHRALINALTLDYWWIKNLYYWDRPQRALSGLFITDVGLVLISGYVIYKKLRSVS